MRRIFSSPKFLPIYSGVLTLAFVLAVTVDVWHGDFSWRVQAAEQGHEPLHDLSLDQLTVHRINVVEPDGTPRLVIADKAEFPGGFYKGREFRRADRQGAGMLFMNDEGTENGGMMWGGYRAKDGTMYSSGHLSFDGYEQDQMMALDSDQEGKESATVYQINDNATPTLFTPEVLSAFGQVKQMPPGPAKQKAMKALQAKYPVKLVPRAQMEREPDGSAVLRLRDARGRTRILLRVTAAGTPAMEFLDAHGKPTAMWPGESSERKQE
jgi:hypothetical protein